MKPGSQRSPIQRGAVAVELCALLLATMWLLPVMVFYARLFWYYEVLQKATHDAARFISAIPVVEMMNTASATQAVAVARQMVADAATAGRISPLVDASTVLVLCDGQLCQSAKPAKPAVIEVEVSLLVTGDGSAYVADWLDTDGWFINAKSQVRYAN